jgi:gluconolactonase
MRRFKADGSAVTPLAGLAACLALVGMLMPAAASAQSLVAPGARVEKLADGFRFTEGPAADAQGNVYFSDIPNQRIHVWNVAQRKLTTFRENSGGANGLFFDKQGNLICCEGTARQVTSISPDGKVTVLADRYDGKRLNSPNDLWVDPDGGIYFSDPRYGNMEGLEQDGFHVYYLAPDRKTLTRVIDDLEKPNGVLGTADGSKLYVADAGAGKTYVYQVLGPGKLGPKKLFAEQGSDGLTIDQRGNVYLTSAGINIYSPEGKLLETIEVPERPANLTFGGPDRKTLFITARTSLYAVPMAVRGDQAGER